MSTNIEALPIAIIGAGPVGLAAAAHLIERGLEPLLLEASTEVGASVRDWGHVRLFSPWRYDIDAAARRLLEASGWTAPIAEELPTGYELFRRYLEPLAALPSIASRLRLGRKVTEVSRRGVDKIRTAGRADVPFVLRTVDQNGHTEELAAKAVIDATGTWWSPNPVGAAGLSAIGEAEAKGLVHYGIPDVLDRHRAQYEGKTTLVVGAGHSAANSILALAELARSNPDTVILWSTRGEDLTRVFGGGSDDGLPARGQLGTDLKALIDQGRLTLIKGFRIDTIARAADRLEISGTRNEQPFVLRGVDRVIAATGQRPDLSLTRELRVAVDSALECVPALASLIDPNEHSCGTVRPHGALELAQPEPNFYVIGGKSYGRAPTFLLATGYEQARSVVAMLAGDREAALKVELDLPETGVCSSNLGVVETSSSCCTPATGAKTSCC